MKNKLLTGIKVALAAGGLAGLVAGSYALGKNDGREEVYHKPVMLSVARYDTGDIKITEFGAGKGNKCYPTGGSTHIPLMNPRGETNYVAFLDFYIPRENN